MKMKTCKESKLNKNFEIKMTRSKLKHEISLKLTNPSLKHKGPIYSVRGGESLLVGT